MRNVIQIGLAGLYAHAQLVLATQELEGARCLNVADKLLVHRVVLRGIAVKTQPCGGVRRAIGVKEFAVAAVFDISQRARELPAIAKTLGDLGKAAVALVVPESPVGGGAG